MSRFKNWQLFAVCVLAWGTTWHAITYQLGHTTPEVGVALRFGLASLLVLSVCALRGISLRFAPRDHAVLALQGALMFGLSYVFVYHAERHLPSGLVAVGYSASPLIAGLGAQALFGQRASLRFVGGGILGLIGVALIFWPEFGKAAAGMASTAHGAGALGASASVGIGAAFTVGAVLLSTSGSLIASRNRHRGLPFWPSMGYGMGYGALATGAIALAMGHRFAPPALLSWWVSLVYLALAGSVLSFACYLTLLERLGPGPSGAIGVMTPLLALVVSVGFEGYRPGAITGVGVLLAVAGNVLMLRRGRVEQPPRIAGSSSTPATSPVRPAP
ncbi:MAG: DMT family transporter [Burkholderiales bacterium]